MKICKKCELCGKEFYRYPCYFKNRSGRFCSKTCDLKNNSIVWKTDNPIKYFDNSGDNNPMGGKVSYGRKKDGAMRKDGYIRIYVEAKKKRVLLHRYLMEQHLGRELLSHEVVHHKDKNNKNNEIDNLELTTFRGHIEKHREQLLAARGIYR